MTKLSYTSETAIAISFLVINLSTYISRLMRDFCVYIFKNMPFLQYVISRTYSLLTSRQQKLILLFSWSNL